MHRVSMSRRYSTGMERGHDSKQFVADLHGRGLTPDDAADIVCQVFCVPRGAARLYVRSHPDWASDDPGRSGGPGDP